MDAREKWVKAAEELADQMSFSDSCSLLYSGTKGVNYEVEFMTKRAQLFAHLRTTPEGFALVPAPEWVPVGERLPVVPEGERSCPIWVASTQDVLQDRFHPCDAEWWKSTKHHYTHWSYRYIEPTPKLPKSESL